MWKILPIVAVVFAIAQAPIPITGKTSDNGAHDHKDKSATANTGANPSAPIPLVRTQDNGSGSLKSESDNASPDNHQGAVNVTNMAPMSVPWSLPSWAIWLGWFANLVLAGVGFSGVIAAVCTLKWIKHQSLSARIGAKAALEQANHLVASDRAWILETISFPFGRVPYQWAGVASLEIPMVEVKIKNQGKSIARIRDFRLRFHTVPDAGKMPPFPDYTNTKKPQELGLNGIMQAPTEESDMSVTLQDITLSKETAKEVESGKIGLWTYGFVEYDTFGEQRITQFCYVWTPSIGLGSAASKPGLRKGGPENYNRAT
jgi:hypothetical protein